VATDHRPTGIEVVTEDVTYDAPGGPVHAWLVRPAVPVPSGRAGILLCHWFSTEEPIGDRDEFLGEARRLAGRGAVCLLPQGRFPWSVDPTGTGADVDAIETEVARLSRGLDLLAEHDDVDGARLGIVGHDFGAMHAAIVAAREDRVRALVLMAPASRWADWFMPFWRLRSARGPYLQLLEPLDTIEQLGAIAPRPVLVQLAEHDPFVPLMVRVEVRTAAEDAGHAALTLETYDAGHDLDVGSSMDARLRFLEGALGLG
jgi:dienelactone hydrolase